MQHSRKAPKSNFWSLQSKMLAGISAPKSQSLRTSWHISITRTKLFEKPLEERLLQSIVHDTTRPLRTFRRCWKKTKPLHQLLSSHTNHRKIFPPVSRMSSIVSRFGAENL